MSATALSPRIGIFGPDPDANQPGRGCNLWPAGYAAAVEAAGGEPVAVTRPHAGQAWDDALAEIDGLVLLGYPQPSAREAAQEERLCRWCREHQFPVLAVDRGMHILNVTFGGNLHVDLPRELPTALQHRHPPEPGVRHAILVENGTRLSKLYGEGEIVVNSEHQRAVAKVAKGFRISARALDGVIEALETESDEWFVLAVQWLPASVTASGLDIQLFRGLVEAARAYHAQIPAGYQAAA